MYNHTHTAESLKKAARLAGLVCFLTIVIAQMALAAVPQNMRIEGIWPDFRTSNPFTHPEGDFKITWDALYVGHQSMFQIIIWQETNGEYHEVFNKVIYSSANKLRIKDYPDLHAYITAHPGRYYYKVRLFDDYRCWSSWSDERQSKLSYSDYEGQVRCLTDDHVYADWFYVNPGYTGYVWNRDLEDWDMLKEPGLWGCKHHHMWGECSATQAFCQDSAGTLYIFASNRLSPNPNRSGALLKSKDKGKTWKVLSINEPGASVQYQAMSMVYNPVLDTLQLICREQGTNLPCRLYYLGYTPSTGMFSGFTPIVPEAGDNFRYANQGPAATVDGNGNLHVAWYGLHGSMGSSDVYICYARKLAGATTWDLYGHYLEGDASFIAIGVIPSLYAAPGNMLHMFFHEMGATGFQHWTSKSTAAGNRSTWTQRPTPFADSQYGNFGNFAHSVAIQPLGLGHYKLHFIAPDTPDDRLGGYTLHYNTYSSLTKDWRWDSGMAIFRASNFKRLFHIPDDEIVRVYEYPTLSIDAEGRMAAAFRIRRSGKEPVDPKYPWSDASHFLTERNCIAWIVNDGTNDIWTFNTSNVLGDINGKGIGGYRAFFAKPDLQTNLYLNMIWVPAEHFSWSNRHFSTPYRDTENPYGFNVFEHEGEKCHFYPLFHSIAYKRIILDLHPGQHNVEPHNLQP